LKKHTFLFSLLVFSTIFSGFLYAQEEEDLTDTEIIASTKNISEQEYELSAWNSTNTLFAYVRDDTVIIVDTKLSKVINRVQLDTKISYLQFRSFKKADQQKLYVLTEAGEIFLVNAQTGKILWVGESYPGAKLTASAFNYRGTALCTGYDNGKVVLYTLENDNDLFTPTEITGLENITASSINFVNFSRDGQFLLFGDADGNLIIWDLKYQTERGRFYYNTEYCKSAFFTGEDNNILMLIDTLTAGVFDFNGELIQKIQLEYSVKRMSISSDGKTVMIVSNNNKRNYFNVNDSGSLEDITQSIAAANTVAQTPATPNPDGTQVPLPNISDGEYHRVIIDEQEGSVQIQTLRPEGEPVKTRVEHVSRYKDIDCVDLGLQVGVAPNPYSINTELVAGYLSYRVYQPFYFGGRTNLGIGFPQKNFPFIYEGEDGVIANPKLFTLKLYGVAGICIYPFDDNIELFTEVCGGYTGAFLWNAKFGTYRATSKWYSCLYTDFKIGMGWKGIKVWIDCAYEPIFNVSINGGAGYEIKMPF